MMKPYRCRPRIERTGIGTDHSLPEISCLQPPIGQILFYKFSHGPVEEHPPCFFIVTKSFVNLFARRSLANPKITFACGSQRIARPANHVIHFAPALDILWSKGSNLIFTPLIVVPELNAGIIREGNEESVDRRAPLKTTRWQIQFRND